MSPMTYDAASTALLFVAGHHFAKGEWGGEWHPDFAPQPGDIVAPAAIDSCSRRRR
jgi:hypothetical protein